MDATEAAIVRAAADVLADYEVADDIATHFTCSEAEAIARFISLMCGEPNAQAFLKAHAEGDDSGDDHFNL